MADDATLITGTSPGELYDHDFYAWAEHQAGLIVRAGKAGLLPAGFDWPRLAEEVEDSGKSLLCAAISLTTRILEHLYLIEASRREAPKNHWRGEIVTFRGDLRLELSPTIRRRA